MDYSVTLQGHDLEYIDDEHIYLIDGRIVPSITGLLSVRFGRKYENVNADVLRRASEKGTAIHDAIEQYCKYGTESDLPEVRNFKFLSNQYGFETVANELPVILCKDGEPISAGRLDMVIVMDGAYGLADIKRTSVLDKEYLAYQLNLYRIAFQQSYQKDVSFLRGIHLRDNVRKFVSLPINEALAWELVEEYFERSTDE